MYGKLYRARHLADPLPGYQFFRLEISECRPAVDDGSQNGGSVAGCDGRSVDITGSAKGYLDSGGLVNISGLNSDVDAASVTPTAQIFDGHTVLGVCGDIDYSPELFDATVEFQQSAQSSAIVLAITDAQSGAIVMSVRSGATLTVEYNNVFDQRQTISVDIGSGINDGERHLLQLIGTADSFSALVDGVVVHQRNRPLRNAPDCTDCKMTIGGADASTNQPFQGSMFNARL